MELYEALKVVAAALLAVFGFVASADKVVDIAKKYKKQADAPDEKQNQRLDAIEHRLSSVETVCTQHAAALKRDLTRFDEIDQFSRLNLRATRAMLEAQLTGNNVAAMQECKKDIDLYLEKGVTNHGSNGN